MRRKRKMFWLCAVCLIVSMVPSACTSKSTPYLSITLTTSKEDQVISQIYQYKIGKQKVELAGEVPYTSQYPLGAYDAGNEIIYYSSRASDGKSDQLFAMDLKTGKTEQLTTELYAINHICCCQRLTSWEGFKFFRQSTRVSFIDNQGVISSSYLQMQSKNRIEINMP